MKDQFYLAFYHLNGNPEGHLKCHSNQSSSFGDYQSNRITDKRETPERWKWKTGISHSSDWEASKKYGVMYSSI